MWCDSLQLKELRMGAPSQEQIDEMIAWGLANRWSDERILKHLATLERWTDEELAAIGVFPPPARPAEASPSMSPSTKARVSPSSASVPRARNRPGRAPG
jgi:hypothetical protein